MIEDKPQGTTPVKLNPIAWEWSCPICDTYHTEYERYEIVTCSREECKTSFFTKEK